MDPENRSGSVVYADSFEYPIEQVEARVVVRLSNGRRIEWYGHCADQNGSKTISATMRYSFWGERGADNGIPIVRFIDKRGNRYHQYNKYTERFPIDTDWAQALGKLEERIRNGPP
jgi:hypothetical protein